MSDVYASTNDVKRGKDALVFFHNRALHYPENYRLKFEELVAFYQNQSKGAFLDGFGFGLNAVDISDGRIQSAMERLADSGKGKLPSNWSSFFAAVKDEAVTVHFIGAAGATIKGTVGDIALGLGEVGKVSLDTLSNLGSVVKYVPFVAFAGLAFYLYRKAKRA